MNEGGSIMANEEWGPLAGLIGTWEGDKGVDVSFHNEKGKISETPFFERTTFKPFGPVENGAQELYGLDYRTAAWRKGEEGENPFHTEIGYWLWDSENSQVMRCFMVPRGSVVIAGGSSRSDATEFVMRAELGVQTYGILSNQYLDRNAKTVQYDCTIKIDGEQFSYDETTIYEHHQSKDPIMHTDRNTLTRVSVEA
jgi:hypothetical protein